jgi:hypothetical protein
LPPIDTAKAAHFRQCPSNQQTDGVLTDLQPRCQPANDGVYVFQRATQFHAIHIGAGIHTKRVVAHDLLHEQRIGLMMGGNDRTGVLLFRNFFGQVWSRNCAHVLTRCEVAQQLAHQSEPVRFYSFRCANEYIFGLKKGRHLPAYGGETGAGDGNKDQTGGLSSLPEVCGRQDTGL